jgi:thiaminase/transcriptional activator TenA
LPITAVEDLITCGQARHDVPIHFADMSEETGGEQPVRTEGSLSASLRDQSERVWAGLHAHPFLRELSCGTLPLEKFRFFIEQDLLYLPEFARCIATGAAKSRTETELRYFTAQLQGTQDLEIPNQRRVLDRLLELGAEDRAGGLGMGPANVAYTSYLQAVAARDGPLEIVAAVLPCAWSYVEIAERLAGERAEHPVYSDWVGFYLTDEVSSLVRMMREDFDSMAREADVGPTRRRQLAEIFTMSSRLEGAFWEMAYTLDQWPDLRASLEPQAALTGRD